MNRMMIDLETLDTKPSAVVLSVGLVVFSKDVSGQYQEHRTNYRTLDLQSQMDRGRTISESTLMWWMKQGREARGAAFQEIDRVPVGQWGEELRVFYEGCEEVWSHGAGFDVTIAIAESLLDGNVPWGHREVRDTRTLSAITGLAVDKPPVTHAHHAVYDAIAQAEWVVKALGAL